MVTSVPCKGNKTLCQGFPTQGGGESLRQKRSVRDTSDDNELDEEDTFEEIKFCPENRYHVQPRAFSHGTGRFVFEVNGTEEIQHFVQLVEIVMCGEVGTECGVGDMRSRRRTACKQDFRRQRMMALDGEGQLLSNMFNVPSGCMCQLLEY